MLREALDDVALMAVETQADRIAALRKDPGHSIFVLDSAVPLDRYTAGAFAFYLIDDPTFLQVVSVPFRRIFAGPEFVEYLMRCGRLTARDEQAVQAGDLVIYLADGEVRHVGRALQRGRVVSKWGSGLLCEHGVWEVPASYGNTVRCCVGPGREDSIALFADYAENQSIHIRR